MFSIPKVGKTSVAFANFVHYLFLSFPWELFSILFSCYISNKLLFY